MLSEFQGKQELKIDPSNASWLQKLRLKGPFDPVDDEDEELGLIDKLGRTRHYYLST